MTPLLVLGLLLVLNCVNGFAVVGYLPEYRLAAFDWSASRHYSHLIFFSLEVGPDHTLSALDRLPTDETLEIARQSADEHGTKLMLCVGGNARSDGFGAMVAKKSRRAKFIRSLQAILDMYGLSGVDYNWEYPRNKQDWNGLWHLIAETRQAFAPDQVISIAIYPDQEQTLPPRAVSNLNFVHAMTYDNVRGRVGSPKHSTVSFAQYFVDNAIKTRIPPAKFTLGVPFYARHTRTGEAKTFADVAREFPGQSSGDEAGPWFWNGPETLRAKVEMAARAGLGGVMVWEAGQDDAQQTLATALSDAVQKLDDNNPSRDEL